MACLRNRKEANKERIWQTRRVGDKQGEVATAKPCTILQATMTHLDFTPRGQWDATQGLKWHDLVLFFKDHLGCWVENYCRDRRGRPTEATAVVQVTSDGGLGRGCGHGNKEKWRDLRYSSEDEPTGLAGGLDVCVYGKGGVCFFSFNKRVKDQLLRREKVGKGQVETGTSRLLLCT